MLKDARMPMLVLFAGLEVSSTGRLATSVPCEVLATLSQPRTYVIP